MAAEWQDLPNRSLFRPFLCFLVLHLIVRDAQYGFCFLFLFFFLQILITNNYLLLAANTDKIKDS